jgi:two-component system chemotaxis response regulator CheB
VQPRNVIVIGASSGGIDALRQVVGGLPADFPAPVCVVLHTSPQSPGILDQILSRVGPLKAITASGGERLRPGQIYVAPADFHLLVEPGVVRTSKGPRENRFRPAIDPLFRSAAQVYGPAAIGVILTGSLDDGTAGLWALKQLGGTAIVQDPAEALYPSMPQNAINHVNVDYITPLAGVAPLLVSLTAAASAEIADRPAEVGSPDAAVAGPELIDIEVKIAMEENPIDAGLPRLGEPSIFACPECHGVLLQLKEGLRVRFRCHTGHAYSVASLLAAIEEGIEESVWNAIRALEEGQLLLSRMAEHLNTSHDNIDVQQLAARSVEAKQQADALRRLIMERSPVSRSTT